MASEASCRASTKACERFQNHKLQRPFEPLSIERVRDAHRDAEDSSTSPHGKCCLIAARLWRCTQNFCGARMMRDVEMRSEIRRAENLVTVMTYERTRCPILNQVPRPERCLIVARSDSSLIFQACNRSMTRDESFARIPTDCYLGVRSEISSGMHLCRALAFSDAFARADRSRCPSTTGGQKFPRPSFGVIEPENRDAPSPNSRSFVLDGSPPVPATWGKFFDDPID